MKGKLRLLTVLCVTLVCAFGEDVGAHYIKSHQISSLGFERGHVGEISLTIKETSLFVPNRYLSGEKAGSKKSTVLLHTSILRLEAMTERMTILEAPKITISSGRCVRVLESKTNGFGYMLDVEFDDPPSDPFEMTVEYSLSLEIPESLFELEMEPVFENADFIPPVFFKSGAYQVNINSTGIVIKTFLPENTFHEAGTTSVRLRNAKPVKLEISVPN